MLKDLNRKIGELQERADALTRQHAGSPEGREIAFSRAFEELSFALEELNVTAEEMRLQGDELAESRLAVESERQRYQDLFDFAPDGYIVTSATGHIEEVNQAAVRMLGVQPGRLVKLPLVLFVREPERRAFRARLSKFVGSAGGDAEPWQCTLKPRGKEPFPASITVGQVRDQHGNVVGLRWLVRDVRERISSEQTSTERRTIAELGAEVGAALTESGPPEAILARCAQAIARHLDAALARIWTLDEETRQLELRASAGILDGVVGVPSLRKFKIGLIAEQREPHLTNALVNEMPLPHREWVRQQGLVSFAGFPLLLDGRVLGVLSIFASRPLTEDSIRGLASVSRSISLGIERQKIQRNLAATLRQLEHTMEAIPDIICTFDADARLVRWNRRLETVTGFSRRELLGRQAIALLPEAEREGFAEALAEARADRQAVSETNLLGKDGSTIPYQWSVVPMKNDEGATVGLTAAGRDISQRIKAERSLSELSVALLKLKDEEQRRIGRELHDSTTQYLAALKMNLDLLDAGSDRLNREERKILSDSASLADQCLKEVRTISYLLHPPLLDEAGLPSALRWYADGFARRSGIRVTVKMSQDFGRLPQQMERTLFRIVQECLTNVHRHSGSPSATIDVERLAHSVSLEVKDEGRGIRHEVGTGQGPGLGPGPGVGIMGMRERLRDLGGRLEIDSGATGTRVRAVLPLTESAVSIS